MNDADGSSNPNAMLWAALSEHDEKGVEEALQNGANANFSGRDGGKPLHSAASYVDFDVVLRIIDLLLCHDADINAVDKKGFTPLMVASLNAHKKTVHQLLRKGADHAVTRMGTGETALHIAMNKNSLATATELLNAGADADAATTDDGSTPLHLAAEFGNILSAEALINHTTFDSHILNAKKNDGKTPYQVAVDNSHHDLAHRLDMYMAPTKDCDKAMFKALIEENVEGLKKALELGADVNHQTPRGDRPIHAAAAKGYIPTLQLLLSKNAKVNDVDNKGYTPLMVASLNGQTQAVEKLLAYGADPKSFSKEEDEKETALHLAVIYNNQGVVKVLLKNGADVNAKMIDGSTPLHIAAEYNALSAAEELMKNTFCDATLTDKNGHNPHDVAVKRGHRQFANLLQSDTVMSESQASTDEDSLIIRVTYGQVKYPEEGIYKNISTPIRGHVLIINNVFNNSCLYRSGSTEDPKNLKRLFEKMGYKVSAEEDLSKRETLDTLRTFSQDPALENVDCVFVFLLSHGEDGKFLTLADQPQDQHLADQPQDQHLADQLQDLHLADQPQDRNLADQPQDQHLADQLQDRHLADQPQDRHLADQPQDLHLDDQPQDLHLDDQPQDLHLDEQEVTDLFKDSVCPYLKGKPKVVLFNFCRGEYSETRTLPDSREISFPNSPGEEIKVKDFKEKDNEQVERDGKAIGKESKEVTSDLLLVYASTEGIMALRNTEEGTFFVKALCQIFAKYAHMEHVRDLVQRMAEYMERERLTTPEVKYRFFKKLYLNPYQPSRNE